MIYHCYKYKNQGGLIYEDEEKTMDDSAADIIYWYYYATENSCSRVKRNRWKCC